MKRRHYIATAAVLVAFAAPGWTDQQANEHKDHHPVTAAATPKSPPATTVTSKPAPAAASVTAKPNIAMADMDGQMKPMRDTHEKMMNAKTSKERNALMAEHIGMNAMGKMSSQGMGP